MTPEIADAIVGIAMTRGGGTFDGNGALVEPEKGFAVGLNEKTFVILALEESGFAYSAMKSVLNTWPDALIGVWVHNGKIYIDPVKIFENRDEAESIGRSTGQIAIYSFESGEIYL